MVFGSKRKKTAKNQWNHVATKVNPAHAINFLTIVFTYNLKKSYNQGSFPRLSYKKEYYNLELAAGDQK